MNIIDLIRKASEIDDSYLFEKKYVYRTENKVNINLTYYTNNAKSDFISIVFDFYKNENVSEPYIKFRWKRALDSCPVEEIMEEFVIYAVIVTNQQIN